MKSAFTALEIEENNAEKTEAKKASKVVAGMLLNGSYGCGQVSKAHTDMGHLASKLEPYALAHALDEMSEKIADGDLMGLESMLSNQAVALQSIFVSLAQQAANAKLAKRADALMTLALKAQGCSRATISALVDIKFPRQSTFVKTANIANGAQQNNFGQPAIPTTTAMQTLDSPARVRAIRLAPVNSSPDVLKPRISTRERSRTSNR